MSGVNDFEEKPSGNPRKIQLLVGVPEIDSRQKKPELLLGYLQSISLVLWPGKLVALQALQPQAESVLVPVDDLQKPSLLIAEQVQMPFKDVLVKLLRHNQRKTIDLFTHVGASWLHKDTDLTPIRNHPTFSSAFTTWARI